MSGRDLQSVQFFFAAIFPFIVLVVASLLSRPPEREMIDWFFGKMKTPVGATPELEIAAMEETKRNPRRFDQTKLFPVQIGMDPVGQDRRDRIRRLSLRVRNHYCGFLVPVATDRRDVKSLPMAHAPWHLQFVLGERRSVVAGLAEVGPESTRSTGSTSSPQASSGQATPAIRFLPSPVNPRFAVFGPQIAASDPSRRRGGQPVASAGSGGAGA